MILTIIIYGFLLYIGIWLARKITSIIDVWFMVRSGKVMEDAHDSHDF